MITFEGAYKAINNHTECSKWRLLLIVIKLMLTAIGVATLMGTVVSMAFDFSTLNTILVFSTVAYIVNLIALRVMSNDKNYYELYSNYSSMTTICGIICLAFTIILNTIK